MIQKRDRGSTVRCWKKIPHNQPQRKKQSNASSNVQESQAGHLAQSFSQLAISLEHLTEKPLGSRHNITPSFLLTQTLQTIKHGGSLPHTGETVSFWLPASPWPRPHCPGHPGHSQASGEQIPDRSPLYLSKRKGERMMMENPGATSPKF